MPATRPSTRVQRRAQPLAPRPASSRRRSPRTTAASTTTPPAEHEVDRPSTIDASSSTTMGTSLSDAALQQIVSAVSQAVLTSLHASCTSPPTTSTQTREVPVMAPGIVSPSANATTQGQVASALQHVSGENFIQVSPPSSSSGLFNFNSVSVAIDAQVSPKLKAKIWANEFIDFGLLLGSHSSDTRYQLSVSSQTGSLAPTLSLEPTQKTKPIPSIEVWTSAFQVFVGVYTRKYPMEAPALMKYGEVVRDLAARGGDWRFHWGNACQGCNFKHQCFKCGVVHPAIRCNFRSSRSGTKPNPSDAKSRAPHTSSN